MTETDILDSESKILAAEYLGEKNGDDFVTTIANAIHIEPDNYYLLREAISITKRYFRSPFLESRKSSIDF